MKAFLIKFDLNINGSKNLLRLVYEETYELALQKLKNEVENEKYSRRIVKDTNLTLE